MELSSASDAEADPTQARVERKGCGLSLPPRFERVMAETGLHGGFDHSNGSVGETGISECRETLVEKLKMPILPV